MVTLLCMGDKTHSQLMECMPEKCGSAAQSRDFESVLSKVWKTSFYNVLLLFQWRLLCSVSGLLIINDHSSHASLNIQWASELTRKWFSFLPSSGVIIPCSKLRGIRHNAARHVHPPRWGVGRPLRPHIHPPTSGAEAGLSSLSGQI